MRPLRSPLAFLLLLAAFTVVGIAFPTPAAAANDGVVTGTITNGTTGEPMPGMTVVLSRFASQTSTESVDTEATTGDDGSFEFNELDTADGFAYMAFVDHLGVTYSSGMLLLSDSATLEADITVYETTTDGSLVSSDTRVLIVSGIDAELGVVTVTDLTTFNVAGDRTYIGSEANRTATFTVPEDALQVSPRPGFDFGSPLVERNVVYATGPMLPGESIASIDYRLPYTGSERTLRVTADVPTASTQILIPTTLAENLSLTGPSDLVGGEVLSIGQTEYRVWILSALERDNSVDLTITGLPEPEVAQRTLRTWTPFLVALGVGLCAAAVTVYGLRSRRLATAAPAAAQAATLRADRERIANELRSLEAAWQAGDVEEERYRDERQVILQELREAARLERQHSGETRR